MAVNFEVNSQLSLPALLGILLASKRLTRNMRDLPLQFVRPGPDYNIRKLLKDLEDVMAMKGMKDSAIDGEIKFLKQRIIYPEFDSPEQEQEMYKWLLDHGDISLISGKITHQYLWPTDFKLVRERYRNVPLNSIISFIPTDNKNEILIKPEPIGKYRNRDYRELHRLLAIPELFGETSILRRSGRK